MPAMALINCPECGHEVLSSAVSCPNCGHTIGLEGANLVRELQRQQAAPPPPPQTGFVEFDDQRAKQKLWAWVTVASGVGLVVGSLLPWATLTAPFVGTVEITATDGDGMLTLIGGLIVGVIGILGLTRGVGVFGLVSLFLAVLLAAFVAFTDLGNVTEMAADFNDEDFGAASVGIGLWLVTVATIIGAVGWFGLLFNRR
jgi:hypothetical protein